MKTAIRLTERDFAVLRQMLGRKQGLGDPLAPLIERKLADAVVVRGGQTGTDIATLDSRVAYRIDAFAIEERTLVRRSETDAVGRELPIDTRRGLAILGMSEGQTVLIALRDGGHESLRLEKVLYQPRPALRTDIAAGPVEAAPKPSPRGRPSLVLVHDADSVKPPLGCEGIFRHEWTGGDDPGPSAA